VTASVRAEHGPSGRSYEGVEAVSDAPAALTPPQSPASEARAPVSSVGRSIVDAVAVRLMIYRGGERLADGTRAPAQGGVVEAEAVYELREAAREGELLRLLNFAEGLVEEPVWLDTLTLSTYIAGPFQAGRLDVLSSEGAASITRVGARRDLAVRLAPGARELRIRYRVRVPRRYWPFGCAQRRCSLSGAIAPLPAEAVTDGRAAAGERWAIAPARWRVESARFAAAPTWESGREPSAAEAAAIGRDEVVVAEDPLDPRGLASYPSVFWGPRWRRTTREYRGVRVEVLHMFRRPGDQYPDERRLQLYRDVAGQVISAMEGVIDVAAASGVEAAPGSRLVVVQGPLRSVLAEAHPTAVLVSDQLLQVVPSERLFEFHGEVVARAGLDTITHGFFAGRHAASVDLWLQGALAMALLEVWRVVRAHRDDFAADILGRFTFVPAVDNFLYAGQAEFAQAYFRGGEDVTPLRNHPWYFANDAPTGRRIHEKLRDLLAPGQLAALYRRIVGDPGGDPIAAAEGAYGRRLGWFFEQWLGPYPRVNYRVGAVESAPVSGGWRHRITIVREGEVGVIEPVQVLAEERGGGAHYLVWNGELGDHGGDQARLADEPVGGEHVFELTTPRPLRAVTIDPRSRLYESSRPPRENVDPLFDNRAPPGGRFLYNGFGLDIAASELATAVTPAARLGALSGFVFLEASLRRDLRATSHFQLYRGRETTAGLGAGVNLWFGPKVNRKRRRDRLRLFANVESLTARGLDPRGGLRASQLVAWIHDTRGFSLWPDRGRRLSLALSASQVLRIDGGPTDHRYGVTIEGGWIELWPLAHRHVFATRIEGAVMIPVASEPEFRGLLRGGGIADLGAYGGDEIFGRAMVTAQAEYRHTFYDDLHLNLVHLAWLRGLGGALFGGVTTVSGCDDYSGLFGAKSYYGQVGYGLMGYLRLIGVTPQLVRLDVAAPLVRRRTVCLGKVLPDYLAEVQGIEDAAVLLPPVTFNITFLQPF
jgi:hypothetical protein